MKRSGFKLKQRKPLRKVRKDSITKLKTKLWHLCREIIFKKHGSDCYTCPAKALSGSNRHLGHFISSSVCSAALRYDLENLRPQCYRCNIHLSGNWLAYEHRLSSDGFNVEALKQRNRDTVGMKADVIWYNDKISEYTTLLAQL